MIQNPVLRGFCPDPSILRVGDDYYVATSTFEWWPGVGLYHSKDLKHWEQLPSPLRRVSQLDMRGNPCNSGIWAPCLSYHDGTFFLIFTDVKTQKHAYYNTFNYVVWTDDITGDWSDPVYLNSTGFDPSLFHDGDKKYLVNMRNGFRGILVQEYDHKKHELTGPVHNIFNGTGLGYTEGPHLYKHNGYYYLMVAEGGTGYGHCVTVARSKDIFGPYEVDPQNPMLTSRDHPELKLQKAGHASLVQAKNGDWYLAHLCSRPVECKTLTGRETAIQPVEWSEDGWLRVKGGGNHPFDEIPEPEGLPEALMPEIPERDDFKTPPGVIYSSMRVPMGDNVFLAEPGRLRLLGRHSIVSNYQVTLLARRQRESCCRAETEMLFKPECPEHVAGMAYLYNNENFYLFVKNAEEDGRQYLILWRCRKAGRWEELLKLPLEEHERIGLRVENEGLEATFSYSLDGGEWTQAGETYDSSFLSDEDAPGFTGAHFAMYCQDVAGLGHPADFTYFELKERQV